MNSFLTKKFGKGLSLEIIKGSSSVFMMKSINVVLSLLVSMLLARLLGLDQFGFYTFVFSIFSIILLPIKSGLPTLIIREVSKVKAGSYEIGRVVFFSLLFILFICLCVYLCIIAFYFFYFPNKVVSILVKFLGLFPILALLSLSVAVLRGGKFPITSQLPDLFIAPILMLFFLSFSYFYGGGVSIDLVISFLSFSSLVALCFSVFMLFRKRLLTINSFQKKNLKFEKAWLLSLLPLTLFSGLRLLDSHIAIIMLGYFDLTKDVGLLKVSITATSLVSFSLLAVNMVLSPNIAKLYNDNKMQELQKIVTFSSRMSACVAFPLSVILILWGESLITLFYGADFSSAYMCVVILLLGQLVNSCVGAVGVILNMTGHDKKTLSGMFFAISINFVISSLLIPLFGMVGAAIGYTVSMTVWNVILMFQVKKYTGINTFFLGSTKKIV